MEQNIKDFNDLPCVESAHVPDIFATEICRIDSLGSCVRFIMTVRDGDVRVIVAKLIVPIDKLQAMIRKSANAYVEHGPDAGMWEVLADAPHNSH